MKSSLVISNFLEEISSLSHSIVFLYLFALITEEGILSLLGILWNSAIKWVYLSFSPLLFASLLFTAICKASSGSHFAFWCFFFLGMVFFPVSCTMSQTSVHSSSGSLSIRSSPLNLFLISTVWHWSSKQWRGDRYPTSKVMSGAREEIPHVWGKEWCQEEIPHVQGKEQLWRDTPHPR